MFAHSSVTKMRYTVHLATKAQKKSITIYLGGRKGRETIYQLIMTATISRCFCISLSLRFKVKDLAVKKKKKEKEKKFTLIDRII